MPTLADRTDVQSTGACLTLSAQIDLRSHDGGLPSKFSGVAYSGGYVPDYQVVIDMASTSYKSPMPLLDSHRRSEIIGVIEQAATDGPQMQVGGRLFSDMVGSTAERIAQLASRGVPYEMSVGLYGFTREFVPAGKSIQVNDQTFNGPVNVLRNGQVREVSIVTLGADPNTTSTFFDSPEGETPMTVNDDQLAAEVATLKAAVEAHPAELAAARAAGAQAERERIQSVKAQSLQGHEKLVENLMWDGKTTGAEAAVAVLQAEKESRTNAAKLLALDAPAPAAAAATPAIDKPAANFSAGSNLPAGFVASGERQKLDAEARAYIAAHPGTDYLSAVKAIKHQGA